MLFNLMCCHFKININSKLTLPFDLKNIEATYQQLVNKIFRDRVIHSIEVYVDDMLVKSLTFEQQVKDLEGTFTTIQRYGMRLNLAKYALEQRQESSLISWSLIAKSMQTQRRSKQSQTCSHQLQSKKFNGSQALPHFSLTIGQPQHWRCDLHLSDSF